MKIALLAPFEERVPPRKYGGIERVVHDLAEQFFDMGHDVTVFASGDSSISGRLVPVVPKAIGSGQPKRIREALTYQGLVNVANILAHERFDVLHNHIGWQALLFREMLPLPVLTTIHWVLDNPCENFMYSQYKSMPVVSISNSQREPLPGMNYAATVYHGIGLKRFPFQKKSDNYLAFLGRFSPVKGPVQAIEIAKKTGQRLIMAAKINEFERDYYEKEIKPHIDGKQIVYIGEVDDAEKTKLLGGARALLSPLQWAEPFGLTNIEAMACGTPVIGTKCGSLPEIIEHGKVGFLCDSIDEMAQRVADIDQIDRKTCREYVEKRFAVRRMAQEYLELYKTMIPEPKQVASTLKRFVRKSSTTNMKLTLAAPIDESV